MRIALICEAFRSIGGIQEVVDNLAVQMLAAGHAVAIVATPYVTPNASRTPAAAAEYFYLDIPSRKPVTWRHPERLLRQPQIAALMKSFEQWRPDVINSHVWDWDKIPILIEASRAARVPLVQNLYDLWGEGRLGKKPLSMLTQAAALIALSEATKAALSRYSPAVRGAHVIIGGVDYKAAQSAEPFPWERPYIFCAARLDLRHKAIDRLILGFAAAAAEFPVVDLLIAGDGPSRAELEKLIERLELASRVRLLGAVSRADLWRYHTGALFFAMPSYMPEGLGLGFLEAMACGRPAVGTASGGVPEIIADGQTGFLLRSNEAGEIGEVLRRMLGDPGRCSRMGQLARETVAARFSWESVANQFLQVYRAVTARRGNVALGTYPQLRADVLRGLPPCKLCGTQTVAYGERNSFAIVRCPGCGFMFAILPEGYRAEVLYSEDSYFTADDPEAERALQQSSTTLSTLYPARLARIREFIGLGRMLDIGCAGGSFLSAAQARGWTVWGVELSGVMRQRASRELGRPVFSSIEEALEGSERFECVTMFEVIEHLENPLETMRNVVRLLAPNGVLAMSTPNCECPEARGTLPVNVWIIPPEHIAYFGPETLALCLKRAGLEILAMEGLEGYWRAMSGDTALPRWISAWLGPLRHGKRLRPGGLSGRWLKHRYSPEARIDLYQRREAIDLTALDTLEIYARRRV